VVQLHPLDVGQHPQPGLAPVPDSCSYRYQAQRLTRFV